MGVPSNSSVNLVVQSSGQSKNVKLRLERKKNQPQRDIAWQPLGIKVVAATDSEMRRGKHPNYSRGLKIIQVKPGSPADNEGILEGDILVAMHGWKTETVANLIYILDQPDVRQGQRFHVLHFERQRAVLGQDESRFASAITRESKAS